jgi:hypothetical protein
VEPKDITVSPYLAIKSLILSGIISYPKTRLQ